MESAERACANLGELDGITEMKGQLVMCDNATSLSELRPA